METSPLTGSDRRVTPKPRPLPFSSVDQSESPAPNKARKGGRESSVGFIWLCVGCEFPSTGEAGATSVAKSKARIYREEKLRSFLPLPPLPQSDHRRSACCPRALPSTSHLPFSHSSVCLFIVPPEAVLRSLLPFVLLGCLRAQSAAPRSTTIIASRCTDLFLPPRNLLPAAIGCLAVPARPR